MRCGALPLEFSCAESDDVPVPSLDSNRGAKRAREARAEAGLDPHAPLTCVLTAVEEGFGIPVVAAALPNEVAGACTGSGTRRLIFVNGTHVKPRQRFTLAHELGHVRCGHDGSVRVDTLTTLDGRPTSSYEIQANAFASEFLVPKTAAGQWFDREPDLEEIVTFAAEYGISAIAALFRAQSARAISEARAERVRSKIEEQLHLEVYERLELRRLDDRLETIAELPYVSPALAGTALGAAISGSATTGAAARAAGVPPARLSVALEAISPR